MDNKKKVFYYDLLNQFQNYRTELRDKLYSQTTCINSDTYESVVHISDMSYAYVCKQHREFQMLIKFSKQNF